MREAVRPKIKKLFALILPAVHGSRKFCQGGPNFF